LLTKLKKLWKEAEQSPIITENTVNILPTLFI